MMRVAGPPCDPLAVYNYRTKWPAESLAAQGQIEFVDLPDLQLRQAQRRAGNDEIVGLKGVPDIDVLVLTRVLAGRLVEVMPLLQREGIAVVVDIDDDFRHTPPLMAGQQKINPRLSPLYNWHHLAKACARADFVTCSTPALRSYAPHGNVEVLRNCVPRRHTTIPRAGDGHTVGWSGTVASHPGDLDVTHGGVGRAIRDADAHFLVVGTSEEVVKRLELYEEPKTTGVVEHEVYPFSLARIDVGIAPLAQNAYNDAKSWLKPLEYTALGIPWVASLTYEYSYFHMLLTEQGVGTIGDFAGDRSRNWRRKVFDALQRPENERQEVSEAARQVVREHFALESEAWRWGECWEKAIEIRKGKNR